MLKGIRDYSLKQVLMTLLVICVVSTMAGPCIAAEPQTAEDFYKLGQDLLAKKDYKAALEAFKQATTLDPTLVDAFIRLGVCQSSLGLHTAAIESFNKAIALDPENAEAYSRKAYDLQVLKQDKEAADALALAQQHDKTGKWNKPV